MARLKGFQKLTNVDHALSMFLEQLRLERLSPVNIPLSEAFGRVAAEDVIANSDLPSQDRSAVDGYAVIAQNSYEASQNKPKILTLTENAKLSNDVAKQVWTGNPLPLIADAVVMLEQTKKVEGKIEVWAPATPGENVSKRGEDVQKGQVVIRTGTRLKPSHVGLLAALEVAHVNVVKPPKVAIICTGNELVAMGQERKPNQIVDSNSWILSGMCLEIGTEPLHLGIAKDNVDEIATRIREGISKADAVITTGGTSVGVSDLVPDAVNQLGKPGVIVHGVSMRPGMPTGLGIVQRKPVFLLSGNPVAVTVGFEVFARPTLLRLLGIDDEPRSMLKAKLTQRVSSSLGSRVFLRVNTYEKNEEFFADPVRVKGSGILTTMTKANGYVIIPENREGLEEGEYVTVHLFDTLRKA